MFKVKSAVWAKLPRAGLGNKLLVWANAYLFAKKNKLPLYTSNWQSIHIGPFLRGEKNKRLYFNDINNDSLLNSIKCILYQVLFRRNKVNINNWVTNSNQLQRYNSLYTFDKLPDTKLWFNTISSNINEVREGINSILSTKTQDIISRSDTPIIAIHIRMGDFRQVKTDEEYNNSWVVRTPLSYFKQCITTIRELSGKDLIVNIFSDGKSSELKELLDMNNVNLTCSGSDLGDILLMSKSKILLTSQGSSFSYWACALHKGIIIHHPKTNIKIRNGVINKNQFEGYLVNKNGDLNNDHLLINNIQKLEC
ncbi:hypothetical protein E9993_15585 [Labilibacter sediminis]|nr:hypothetical protein E9993_15585 [Labilibacter sediminis]